MTAQDPPTRRSLRRRLLPWLIGVLVAAFVAVELVARFVIGLGDPPLYVPDPDIEYVIRPGVYQRFGHEQRYNEWSMRGDAIAKTKASASELRVMMLGDSIINGGAHTGQADLVSERLQTRLNAAMDRPVVVGNISTSSWGPANLLAYVRRHGFFDADVVVIVVTSSDMTDVPSFDDVAEWKWNKPSRRPWLATSELAGWSYDKLMARLGRATSLGLPDESLSEDERKTLERQAVAAFRELIGEARATGATVLIGLHKQITEIPTPMPGYQLILDTAEDLDVGVIPFTRRFERDLAVGTLPYRDVIHPNERGHELMTKALEWHVRDALEKQE